MQEKLINEEYKIWKKNSVFLYDIFYGYARLLLLTWSNNTY